MNKHYIYIGLISALSVFSNLVIAQDLTSEVFRTDKNTMKVELPEANRNFEKINYDYKQTPAAPQKYEATDVTIKLPELTTKINVVTIKQNTLAKLYGNYVKAGFGNYTSPYLEAFINNKRSETLAYGLHLKHFSSKNGPVKKSGTSENLGDAYVRYFTKKSIVNAALAYTRDRFNLYGYDHAKPIEKDTIKRLYNTFYLTAGVKSLDQSADLLYDARFSYYNFSNNKKAKEDEYLLNVAGEYKLDSDKTIKTDAVLSISNYKDSIKINRSFFQLKPALVYNIGKYRLTGGLNIAYTSDTVNTEKVHLYPRLHADVDLIENSVTAFAGLDGEMQKNTWRSFVSQNPYLQSDVLLLHSNKSLELYGGIKGNLSGIDYKVKLASINYNNLYFFNNSITDSSEFSILYDKNTRVFNFEGDVSYQWEETFKLGLNVNYFNYNTGVLEKAWQRPSFISLISASYNLQKKIFINADIYYLSGLAGKNYISNKEVKLDGIFDLNLKADYKFSSAFSAFIEVNNIFSKKYQRYLYYPVKGINVLGGIAYSF